MQGASLWLLSRTFPAKKVADAEDQKKKYVWSVQEIAKKAPGME